MHSDISMPVARQRLAQHAPWWIGLAVFVLGVLAALAASRWQLRHNEEVAAQRFAEMAHRVTDNVAVRMHGYEKGLRGLRGAVAMQQGRGLRQAQMLAYSGTRDIGVEFPGARGFGVIWRVPASEEQAFVANARADGRTGFAVRQFHPNSDERFVIAFIEPVERNRQAVGLDIGSEPSRRRAAVTAMRSGQATLSGPVQLVQTPGPASGRGFVLALPIYRPGMAVSTPQEREAATTGWTYAPLMFAEVLAGADPDEALYSLRLRDTDPVDGGVFHETPAQGSPSDAAPSLSVPLPLYGRQWMAELRATPAFMHSLDQRDPQALGLAVAVVGALVGGLVALLGQALQRSRRVHLEVARRAAIVDSSEEAIIAGTLEGVVTEWNAGAERLFGVSAAEALGRQAATLLLPPGRHHEDADIRATIARGERVLPLVTTRRHADGSLIDVSLTASPVFDASGQCIGFAKIMRDIRAARRAQRELAELNAQLEQQVADRTAKLDAARHTLQAILDAMPSQIGYWNRALRNQVANRAYRDWFGVDPDSLAGVHMRELLGEEAFAENHERLEAALSGERQTFQGRPIPRPDGKGERQALVNYLPDIVDGEVRGIFTLVHDVTELVEGRLALAAARRAQAALLQTLDRHSIVSVADREGNILSANEAFCRISGYAETELVGQNHRIVNSGSHAPEFWRGMWRTLGAGESWRGEVCNRAKDGSLYWVDSVVAPFFDVHGRIEKYVSIRNDITPIKRLQQEAEAARVDAERSSRFLREVLGASTQFSIIACDTQGIVIVFNQGAERLLGHRAEDVVGRRSALEFHVHDELAQRRDALALRLGRPVPTAAALVDPSVLDVAQEWRYRRNDGSTVAVSLAVTAMHDASGRTIGYLGIAHDISGRLRHEERLRQAVLDARRANEAKGSFLANMSHEIRTPMNAVIGLAYVLERTRLDAEQAATLSKIRLAGQTLLAIINDVLDLSKFEAGEMRLERAPVHLPTLLREVVQLLSVQADARGIGLRLELPPTLEPHVQGDATRLRQVLTNLLGNAIKFTEEGGVCLRVEAGAVVDGCVPLRFEVSDTGIGIAPEAVERLFSPFVQADSSTTRRFGGTGLGLSIVKQLVDMMGGQVHVHSTPGEGSTFVVALRLPLAEPPLPAPMEHALSATGAQLEGLRVLVVDDNPLNLEVARRILALEGATVRLATDGLGAVELLLSERDAFDAVLMDVQMPTLDGLDATRRIRSALGLTRLPIIGLTAGVSASEHLQARGAGMNEVLGKPIDPPALVRCIRLHAARPGTRGSVVDAPGPAVPATAALDPVHWPPLAGIDARMAAYRLNGDHGLFRRMLRQMVGDFADLAQPPDGHAGVAAAQDLPALASRLHLLKGLAGTLAAEDLAALAARAEGTARKGQAVPDALMCALAEALRALRAASEALPAQMEPLQAPAEERPASPGDSQAGFEALQAMLRQSDLSALEAFAGLAPGLQQRMGADAFAAMRAHMEQLDFGAALACLEDTVGQGVPA